MTLFPAVLYIKVESHNIRDPVQYATFTFTIIETCKLLKKKKEEYVMIAFLSFFRRDNAIVNDTILTFMECNGIPPGCHGNLQKQTPVN